MPRKPPHIHKIPENTNYSTMTGNRSVVAWGGDPFRGTRRRERTAKDSKETFGGLGMSIILIMMIMVVGDYRSQNS